MFEEKKKITTVFETNIIVRPLNIIDVLFVDVITRSVYNRIIVVVYFFSISTIQRNSRRAKYIIII